GRALLTRVAEQRGNSVDRLGVIAENRDALACKPSKAVTLNRGEHAEHDRFASLSRALRRLARKLHLTAANRRQDDTETFVAEHAVERLQPDRPVVDGWRAEIHGVVRVRIHDIAGLQQVVDHAPCRRAEGWY